MRQLVALGFVLTLLINSCASSLNDLLETAEDEAALFEQAVIGADGSPLPSNDLAWADGMRELVLGDDGVDDEVLPTVPVGATQAELLEATPNAFAALRRKQLSGGLTVEVLESQLVVVRF